MTYYFDIKGDVEAGTLKLVDLRSPGEFLLGHMPRAKNIPLFSDNERAEVGTIYKQIGAHEAVQHGLELLAQKIEGFVDQLLELAGPRKKLAIHCWRGGMRSQAVAKLLQTLGVEVILLDGGYKTYRKQVLALLDGLSRHKLLVLNGRTGSGKTAVIRMLASRKVPVIDFEGVACHRGSAIGDINIAKPQPSQQNFENEICNQYFDLKSSPTIIVESEQDLGLIRMPIMLRKHIFDSEMILLEQTMADRVAHLRQEYVTEWGELQDTQFARRMLMLKKHIQGPIYDKIISCVALRDFEQAIELFLRHRYDSCYDKSLVKHARKTRKTISISEIGWDRACDEIQSAIQ